MSTWRARAIELFPELRPQVEAADSIAALWIELGFRLEHHYRDNPTESSNLFRSICLYAIWCMASPSQAVQDAADIEFYCYLPQFALRNRAVYERFIRDLTTHLPAAQIAMMGASLEPEELKRFHADVQQAEESRQLRSRRR